MKKVVALTLTAAMVLSTAGLTMASEVPEDYTQVKVFDGTYGFGDAEITVSTNDDFSAFYITFECFDEEQILEGTVADGVVTVDYDLTGFVSGDAQQMWDDAQASENIWEPITAEISDKETVAEADDAAAEYDFENWSTIIQRMYLISLSFGSSCRKVTIYMTILTRVRYSDSTIQLTRMKMARHMRNTAQYICHMDMTRMILRRNTMSSTSSMATVDHQMSSGIML